MLDGSMVAVMRLALEWGVIDFSIVETHRGQAEQDRYYALGKSKVEWPNGKHNTTPSAAVDAVPWVNGAASYDWRHCLVLAGVIMAAASCLGVSVRWGGCWGGNPGTLGKQNLNDLVHFEIKG